MTDENNTLTPVTFQEAPASWSTKYIDQSGFECQLTLRAINGSDLLKKAGVALKTLIDAGSKPVENCSSSNGKSTEKPQMTVCEFHNAEMRRHEKDGKVWYSHRLADGTYCNGKAHK
jgi:hypothetical protein